MTINPKQYPKLARLVDQHEKNIDAFQAAATLFFHPYAVELCERIRRGIPEFEGCQLAMRMLFLEPRDLQIPMLNYNGEECTERLNNLGDYLDPEPKGWKIRLPEDTIDALRELDTLSNYIDDNYSMVGDLSVTLPKESAPKKRKAQPVKEHKRLMKMDFNRIAAAIRQQPSRVARRWQVQIMLPQLKESNPRFDVKRFRQACNA